MPSQQESDFALNHLLCQGDYLDDLEPEKSIKGKRNKNEEKKHFKTVSQGKNTGKFTDDEIEKFKNGLEMYGRDWKKVPLS
jgi:hypothetical protein